MPGTPDSEQDSLVRIAEEYFGATWYSEQSVQGFSPLDRERLKGAAEFAGRSKQ